MPCLKKFKNELDSLNLKNLVLEPTTRSIHILDLVIINKYSNLVGDLIIEPDIDLSDHKLIHFKLSIPRKARRKIVFSYRKKDQFDPTKFIDTGTSEFESKLRLPCICNPDNLQASLLCLQCYSRVAYSRKELHGRES